MTIDQPPFESIPRFKSSHRSRAEQAVGFSIFLIISLAMELLNGWLLQVSYSSTWFQNLIQSPWSLSSWAYGPMWTLFYMTLTLGIWSLWRRHSLRTLKLEVSLFLAQYALQAVWATSFFVLKEPLLALISLLLLWFTLLLCVFLFWKKEKISGGWLIPAITWIAYLWTLNMIICMANP